jgi:hypothetical protein
MSPVKWPCRGRRMAGRTRTPLRPAALRAVPATRLAPATARMAYQRPVTRPGLAAGAYQVTRPGRWRAAWCGGAVAAGSGWGSCPGRAWAAYPQTEVAVRRAAGQCAEPSRCHCRGAARVPEDALAGSTPGCGRRRRAPGVAIARTARPASDGCPWPCCTPHPSSGTTGTHCDSTFNRNGAGCLPHGRFFASLRPRARQRRVPGRRRRPAGPARRHRRPGPPAGRSRASRRR